ncbi:MAG: hypothetical protein E6I05_10400 [Chloroflexi bacterium]|nr:MAG: hypothetical protein E6I05_10400 [Chloroflexota bacterium]
MRRTTSRSSNRTGARRASSSRSKRSKRAARPRLSSRQLREIAGVLLMLAALLGLLAIASNAGSILGGIRDGMLATFGTAWFVPVGATLALAAYLLWPKAPRPRTIDIVAGLVAVLSLVGLFGLAARAGGSVGLSIDYAIGGLVGTVGTWALLIAGLVIGLIVTIHFSPGALLATAVGTLRAAYAERTRIRDLVAAPGAEKPKTARPVAASNDLLTRSAASFATAPATPDHPSIWDVDEPDDRVERKPPPAEPVAVAVEEPPPLSAQAALRVVAEPEDDLPEIEWKLPSITLLDTVTARRERMADEIKRNVRVIETAAFREGSNKLALGLGNDVSGQSIVADLTRMPHLLIAGATGQGKSVCINALITSLLFQVTPDHLRLLLIDPKRVELTGYNGLPHLALPVLVESHQAAAALRWAVAEMDRRYKLFSAEGVRNIAAYNEKASQKLARSLPYVVIVIDELADLMMVAAGEIEELICRIAQLARAVGIHLIIATQRPSTDIITGLIKANIPSRIAFAVGSQVDSRVILDAGGAEKLLGRGDMLYQPVDAGKPTRIQGAFVSDPEVEGVVNFWKTQGAPRYMEEILEEGAASEWDGERREERKLDPLFARSARAVAAEGGASVSLVQRKFNVGYSRAGRIVDQLAEHRVIGGYQGSKSREVLMTLPDVDDLLDRLGLE